MDEQRQNEIARIILENMFTATSFAKLSDLERRAREASATGGISDEETAEFFRALVPSSASKALKRTFSTS